MRSKQTKIPKFKTEEEEARFWQKHSPLEFEDEFKEVTGIHFPPPKRRIIALRKLHFNNFASHPLKFGHRPHLFQ